MGVPSYFAYIIKNHPQIIQKIIANKYHRLYMDCNSILYDAFYEIKNIEEMQEKEIYDLILAKAVEKIEKYIHKIKPLETVFIAFDGVAPFAKMEQQRNRRYKGRIGMTASTNKITTSIFTPGTRFMQLLSEHMKRAFLGQESKYHVNEILLATPKDAGEGEHKLYVHLRENPIRDKKVAVYGLDADLIMLSIFHLAHAENIYVFREAPEFMKSALKIESKSGDQKNELWCLDIAKLGRSIANEMACSYTDNHRMYDYVFLCFFLGNDFLPHFPALNIRTQGITRLLDTYRMTIGNKPNTFLISKTIPYTIQWNNLSRFITSLAKNEKVFIQQEYALRKKWDYMSEKYERMSSPHYGKNLSLTSLEREKEREDMIQSIPVIFRQEETYICPYEVGWESRYYDRFFSGDSSNNHYIEGNGSKKRICINYLEGLEWVLKYYIQGCPNWRWKYTFLYPPLLVDLVHAIPTKQTHTYFSSTITNPTNSMVQLACVLPKDQLHLLPTKYVDLLLEKHAEWYPTITDIKIQWAFCRYLWESHLLLPEISVDMLEKEFDSLTYTR